MGRRKIEVQKIEDKNKCVATFRKRRDGLFKKALELHRLTGAEITLSLVYNKSRYYFSSHGDTDDGDVINNFHYTKHFQFKACGSHLPHGCNETNCSSKLSNNSHSSQKNETSIKRNSFPLINSGNNCTKYKYKSTKLTSEERLANLRYLIVDELFKQALTRFRSLTKVTSLNKKQSIISPCYNSSGSWTMLSPSSIIPSYEVSSSHLVDQSEKVFNDENILSIVQTHTNSPLFESNYQSLQFIYSPNNLSYSSSMNTTTDQQLSKEFNSSPLSQILEVSYHDNDESEVDNNNNNNNNSNNEKQYLDLDNDTSQPSYFTELQTPNMICYLDEPINYYSSIDDNPLLIEESTN
ncbi:uncharacterized protein DC041_0009102 [Schistosoma bovis]|uniref:MADS-box domain-containing protein n=1 Tax=Schistosoma bovis TaxID=6184 RepID=A0A430QF45_SCHBO|nr:uncharacterized protein DC041_0009102 [Schistosoma bovis]